MFHWPLSFHLRQCRPKGLRVSLLQEETRVRERHTGVTAIAALFCVAAVLALGVAGLIYAQAVPLSFGSFLIGGDLYIMGPVLFLIYAAVHFVCAWGLWKLYNWARWLSLAVLAFGFLQTVPDISMAVADFRYFDIARNGLEIIVRIAAIWYLMQEPVREEFG